MRFRFASPDNTYATRTLASLSEQHLMPSRAEVFHVPPDQWVLVLNFDYDVDEAMAAEVRAHASDFGMRELPGPP